MREPGGQPGHWRGGVKVKEGGEEVVEEGAHSTCAAILVACGLEPDISLSPCNIGSR